MPTAPATTFHTGCKINIHLAILERLQNGYHALESIMYPLGEPHDVITVFPGAEPDRLTLACPGRPDLETGKNILYSVWSRMKARVGSLPGIHVRLEKNVPSGAGLGGGSANAAGFLEYLCTFPFLSPLAGDERVKIAAEVGADVPFFLMRSPAFVSGIGENVLPVEIPSLSAIHLLLVCPRQHVSTAWAYAEWDRMMDRERPADGVRLTAPFPGANLTLQFSKYTKRTPRIERLVFYNSFENAVFNAYPGLRRIKEDLWKTGAQAALMSGSGSSLFGLYETEKAAARAAHFFQARGNDVFLQILQDKGVSPSW